MKGEIRWSRTSSGSMGANSMPSRMARLGASSLGGEGGSDPRHRQVRRVPAAPEEETEIGPAFDSVARLVDPPAQQVEEHEVEELGRRLGDMHRGGNTYS